MRPVLLIFISLAVSLLISNHGYSQNANLGVGYGVGYYYRSLDNPKASLVMLNYSDKDWYSDKVTILSYSHGYDIEIRGKSFFLLTFGVQKNKTMGGGTDPSTGQREDFELRHFNGRLGLGIKVNTGSGRTAFGMAFNLGLAGYRYLITGNNSIQTEKKTGRNCHAYHMEARRSLSTTLRAISVSNFPGLALAGDGELFAGSRLEIKIFYN